MDICSGFVLLDPVLLHVMKTSRLRSTGTIRVLDFLFQETEFVQELQDIWLLKDKPEGIGWLDWVEHFVARVRCYMLVESKAQ